MSSFAPNTYMPQPLSGHRIGIHNQANPMSFARYSAPYPGHHNKLPLSPWPETETSFRPRTAQTAQKLIPHDVLEQRARTPCRHFEHHGGWCPYGSECHFFHDYSRLTPRGSSSGSNPPSVASSTCSSSLRSSPVPSLPYQAPFVPHAPVPAYVPPRFSSPPRQQFTPRTIGGTTYFPIRLGDASLGYVTPSGVEVFMDH
ncbi:hypothetical protein DFH94DRAFT_707194 [Russula ochroleuca]|uniref:C3H1-type domain-containing protein n=1 Tax=Russula ochroleuca TaxID=152965 RepID=A0A9P5N3N0_9AGAM|nr:hypothetical protein DFH94DRAFT_707194 [Russula ochroleuca]